MVQQFLQFIQQAQLFTKQDKILLAVSGGMDSMAMAHLFRLAALDFGIAHCNFNLRGEASDGDERLVKSMAKKWDIPFFSVHFDTSKQAAQQKTSIQIVARTLRYDWLESVRKENEYTYIATAHHLKDSLETVLYNLAKGCGIRGLHGIPIKQDKIIRPLLFATKEEVNLFVKKQSVPYRDDASNQSIKYKRNLIRHKVLPQLEIINPSLEKTFSKTVQHIKDTELLFEEIIQQYIKRCVVVKDDQVQIQKAPLEKHPANRTILYEILTPYSFNGDHAAQILSSLSNVGSVFYSTSHQLLIDRDLLIVQATSIIKENYVTVKKNTKKVNFNSQLIFFSQHSKTDITIEKKSTKAFLDAAKIKFPIRLRYWQAGDRFQPLGMKGKSKKLQDFFSDLKLTRFEKERVLLLESEGKICWVAGHRIDDRFKITEATEAVLVVELMEN